MMQSLFFRTSLVCAVGAVVASAQPAPGVEDLVAMALDSSPSIEAMGARLEAAREMVAPAGALPDPMVETMFQDAGFPSNTVGKEEMSMLALAVRQELPYPGRRRAQRDAAAAEADVRAADLELVRRQVALAVRQAYARLYALDSEARSLSSARELLDLLAATAAARYGAGETEQEAVVKAQLEVSRLDERLADIAAERAALASGVDRLLDRAGDAPIGEVVSLPPVEAPPGPWETAAMAASAEVAVRRASVAAAERRVAVAEKEQKPTFTASASVGERGSLDPVVTASFGVVLPLWKERKQEPMLRAAEAELRMARLELRDAEAMARAEAARLFAQWQRLESQVNRFEQAIVPGTSAAVDAARASYLAGRGDFSVVVEDFNTWLDARVELERFKGERYQAWAELVALAGPGRTE
ncbi:MAG: TolC family protein [Acidobacteriota bacterium]